MDKRWCGFATILLSAVLTVLVGTQLFGQEPCMDSEDDPQGETGCDDCENHVNQTSSKCTEPFPEGFPTNQLCTKPTNVDDTWCIEPGGDCPGDHIAFPALDCQGQGQVIQEQCPLEFIDGQSEVDEGNPQVCPPE